MSTSVKPTAQAKKEQTAREVIPHIEGNKGFNFARPVSAISGKINFGIALTYNSITANIPRQIQLVMNEWLALGGGDVDVQAISDSLITKGLWVRASGVDYNQDVATILLHYRTRLDGRDLWGSGKNATKLKLADFS
tara:strand:+ start:191 stop:601 length:411 start_codon:yes stop_codon:yes gene_type:complete